MNIHKMVKIVGDVCGSSLWNPRFEYYWGQCYVIEAGLEVKEAIKTRKLRKIVVDGASQRVWDVMCMGIARSCMYMMACLADSGRRYSVPDFACPDFDYTNIEEVLDWCYTTLLDVNRDKDQFDEICKVLSVLDRLDSEHEMSLAGRIGYCLTHRYDEYI